MHNFKIIILRSNFILIPILKISRTLAGDYGPAALSLCSAIYKLAVAGFRISVILSLYSTSYL